MTLSRYAVTQAVVRRLVYETSDAIDAQIFRERDRWGWFLTLGLALAVLGVAAILYANAATWESMARLGVIMFAAGTIQLFVRFQGASVGRAMLYVIRACELLAALALMQGHTFGAPFVGLLLTLYLTVAGTFRIFFSLCTRLPSHRWLLASGIITLTAGVLLLVEPFRSIEWFAAYAVGFSFVSIGITWGMLGLKLKPDDG